MFRVRPRLWEFGDLSDSLDGLAPVVGGGLVHQQTSSVPFGGLPPDTLLGFEATGPLSLRPECGKPGIVLLCEGVVVVAPSLVVGCGI